MSLLIGLLYSIFRGLGQTVCEVLHFLLGLLQGATELVQSVFCAPAELIAGFFSLFLN